jgi:hypothetical protein
MQLQSMLCWKLKFDWLLDGNGKPAADSRVLIACEDL